MRECEASVAQDACFEFQATLLDCYERSDARDWKCFESSFQEIPRPLESVCQYERDALIECEYPRVRRCLDICRTVRDDVALDAGIAIPEDRICPSLEMPCDSMCWALDEALARANVPMTPVIPDAAPRAADAGNVPMLGAGEDRTTALFRCAAARATDCIAGDAAGDAAPADANWTTVSRDCARDLGLL